MPIALFLIDKGKHQEKKIRNPTGKRFSENRIPPVGLKPLMDE
jgi:hypothetical protein